MPIDRVVAIEQRFGEVRSDEAGGAGDDDAFFHSVLTLTLSADSAQYACLWKNPRSSVSHMILRSRRTDQFSM